MTDLDAVRKSVSATAEEIVKTERTFDRVGLDMRDPYDRIEFDEVVDRIERRQRGEDVDDLEIPASDYTTPESTIDAYRWLVKYSGRPREYIETWLDNHPLDREFLLALREAAA